MPWDPLTALPASSLKGKVALVTGGNTGIGLETVRHLARAGARVLLAARSESKAQAAIEQLREDAGEGAELEVEWVRLDLSSLRAVREAARGVLEREERLDIVVCNAGVMAMPYTLTEDGLETQLQTNHLAHFLFIQTLLPLLLRTASETHDVRIVSLSSLAHLGVCWPFRPRFRETADFNVALGPDWTGMGPGRRYTVSKLANVLFTAELDLRHRSQGLTCLSVHPGVVRTDLYQHVSRNLFYPLARPVFNALFVTPAEGAVTSLYAATSPEVLEKGLQGAYLVPYAQQATPSAYARDPELARELWELSERVLEEKIGA